jgi:hypothetical protein
MAMRRAGAVHDALGTANVREDQTRAAAEEIDLRGEFASLRGEFSTVKWMLGTLIVMVGGLYVVMFGFAINHASFG